MAKKTIKKTAEKKIVFVQDLTGATHPISLTAVETMHPALKNYFCYCLFKASTQIKTIFEQALAPFRFQTVHYAILCVLEQENNPTQHQVGELIGIDKASMVKLVDHLESLKIIERLSGSDRRCKMLHITHHGHSVFRKAKEAACKAEKRIMKALNTEEQSQLRLLLPRLFT